MTENYGLTNHQIYNGKAHIRIPIPLSLKKFRKLEGVIPALSAKTGITIKVNADFKQALREIYAQMSDRTSIHDVTATPFHPFRYKRQYITTQRLDFTPSEMNTLFEQAAIAMMHGRGFIDIAFHIAYRVVRNLNTLFIGKRLYKFYPYNDNPDNLIVKERLVAMQENRLVWGRFQAERRKAVADAKKNKSPEDIASMLSLLQEKKKMNSKEEKDKKKHLEDAIIEKETTFELVGQSDDKFIYAIVIPNYERAFVLKSTDPYECSIIDSKDINFDNAKDVLNAMMPNLPKFSLKDHYTFFDMSFRSNDWYSRSRNYQRWGKQEYARRIAYVNKLSELSGRYYAEFLDKLKIGYVRLRNYNISQKRNLNNLLLSEDIALFLCLNGTTPKTSLYLAQMMKSYFIVSIFGILLTKRSWQLFRASCKQITSGASPYDIFELLFIKNTFDTKKIQIPFHDKPSLSKFFKYISYIEYRDHQINAYQMLLSAIYANKNFTLTKKQIKNYFRFVYEYNLIVEYIDLTFIKELTIQQKIAIQASIVSNIMESKNQFLDFHSISKDNRKNLLHYHDKLFGFRDVLRWVDEFQFIEKWHIPLLFFRYGLRLNSYIELNQKWHYHIQRFLREINTLKKLFDVESTNCEITAQLPWFHHVLDEPCTIDDVDIKPIITADDLIKEGDEMNHCVGSYVRSAQYAYSMIISLTSKIERSTGDISYDDNVGKFYLRQLQRHSDKKPHDSHWIAAKKLIDMINTPEKIKYYQRIKHILSQISLNKVIYTQEQMERLNNCGYQQMKFILSHAVKADNIQSFLDNDIPSLLENVTKMHLKTSGVKELLDYQA